MAVYTQIDNPELYFQCKLYTGTGSAASITLDGDEDMQPDLIWIKNRDGTDWHDVTDSVRGVAKSIFPNNTIQQIISITKNKNLKKIAMENDTRQRLRNIFRNDIKKLSNLIQKDLSHWL